MAGEAVARRGGERSAQERYIIILFAFLGTLFDGADFSIFLYFLSSLSKYFGTTLVNVAAIQASSYLAGIVGGILFGIVADQRGRRFGLSATIATYSIFTLAAAFAPNFAVLLILRIIAGIGIGGESGIAFAYINEVLPARESRRGFVSGLLQTMFLVGGFISAWLFAFTSAHFGAEAWRWAFGLLGVAAVLAALVRVFMPESRLWLESRGRRAAGEERAVPLVEIFQGALGARTLWATLLMTFGFLGAYAVITYAPTMWTAVFKFPPALVARLGYAGNAAAIIGYVTGGWLADARGRRAAFTYMGLLGTAGYAFFLLTVARGGATAVPELIWVSLPFWAFIWVELGYGYFGAQGVWLSELFPTHVRTTAQNFAYYVGRALGAGVGPLVALIVAQAVGGDVRLAIGLGAIGTLLTVVVARVLPETKGLKLESD